MCIEHETSVYIEVLFIESVPNFHSFETVLACILISYIKYRLTLQLISVWGDTNRLFCVGKFISGSYLAGANVI